MFIQILQRSPGAYRQVLFMQSRWKSKRFADTILLPKTLFPLSMKDGVIPQRETQIQKECAFKSLYEWQRNEDREKVFVLHDGPPYANGDLHVGHFLNKVLKDIVNRYKLLQGYKIHYVPGWDCHGMPIEQKALGELRLDHTEMSTMDIRNTARKFAEKTVKKHAVAFQRWGIMADWEKGFYVTLDKQYEVNQLEVFYEMYNKGHIYEDYMPVYWSPSSRSALAEAELEYKADHRSIAAYVKFPVTEIPQSLQSLLGATDKLHVLIWTTTPWTLPLNLAVCYGPSLQYSLVRSNSSQEVFVICSDFVEKMKEVLKKDITVISEVPGTSLAGLAYVHPGSASSLPLLPADHVSRERGTGLVHTAPAHGPEDFQVALRHGLRRECHVDESGCYKSPLPACLVGKEVLGEGNLAALELFGDLVVEKSEYVHSYPYDWRTKQPVIFRASKQWFVNTANIKDKAKDCLDAVSISPPALRRGMDARLDARTYWCISRQRVWGVPIPTFYNANTEEVLVSRASIDHLKSLFVKHGSDCWWTLPMDELLPRDVIEKSGHDPNGDYRRGEDIMDIWFDSGCSWATVLKGSGTDVADMYLEGLDQLGGWFQSSLLTCAGAQDRAPYKSLLVHGFAVDEEGRKMSKSIGNVVDPQRVINGGKSGGKTPAYGADVLRWWVARSGLEPVVNIGPSVLDRLHEQVFKVRKSLRYLMANLDDFSGEEDCVDVESMSLPDKHMLHLLYTAVQQVTEAYEAHNYSRVATLLEQFINAHVSAHYCHITKHRMYCTYSTSLGRRSCQTVQYHLLRVLTTLLAPILPHLAEEVVQYPPLNAELSSVFKSSWPDVPREWYNPSTVLPMDICASIKDTLNPAVSPVSSINFDVVICVGDTLFTELKRLQADSLSSMESSLAEVLQVSMVTLLSCGPVVIPDDSMPVEGVYSQLDKAGGMMLKEKFLLLLLSADHWLCPRCRRMTAPTHNTLCHSCQDVLAEGWEAA